MRRWMSWIGYTLFGIMMFIFFLYLGFPYQRVKAMLVTGFQSYVPAQLTIDAVKANPPLGVAGRNILVSTALDGERIELLRADQVVLRFLPLSWIQGKAYLRVDVHAYGGTIYTVMNIHHVIDPINKPFEVVIQGIDLGRHTALRTAIAQELAGLLDGEIKLYPKPGGPKKCKLGGQFKASDVVIDGIRNIPLSPGRLTFSKIDCAVALSNGILHVAMLRARGREAEGTLKGTLSLRDHFRASTLNMRGRVLIKSILAQRLGPFLQMATKSRSATGEIPFVLTGTLDRPNLRLTGIKL